jgi:hypothetical protein
VTTPQLGAGSHMLDSSQQPANSTQANSWAGAERRRRHFDHSIFGLNADFSPHQLLNLHIFSEGFKNGIIITKQARERFRQSSVC